MDKLLKKDSSHFQMQSKAMDIRRDESGEIKSIVLEGYASTRNKDRVNDIVLPTAFEKALDMYMKNPRVFLQHDSSKNVGSTIEASINSKGLYVKTEIKLNISLDGTNEVRLFDAIEKGLYKTYSIGYRVNEVEEKEIKEAGVVVGYEWVIKDLDLMEISLVSVPANPYALIKSIEDCLPENTKMDKEQGIDQIKELTGEANIVEEEKEEVKEEEQNEEIVEEVTEEVTEEVNEEEVEEKEVEVEIKEESPEEVVEETVEPAESVSEEVATDSEEVEEVEETENSDEISEDVDEKSHVVEQTKEIETQKEVVAKEKDYDAIIK